MLFYNNGAGKGADAVAHGEILYQKKERGQTFSESEQKICFHPMKGYLIGVLGTLPFLIAAVILAVKTAPQVTGAGSLPSWMQAYTRRSDIGDALISYTQPEDVLYMLVRNAKGINYLDTIRIKKENYPHFESVDCQVSYFHEITAVSTTHNAFDSIAIHHSSVNYDTSNDHFYLYVKKNRH